MLALTAAMGTWELEPRQPLERPGVCEVCVGTFGRREGRHLSTGANIPTVGTLALWKVTVPAVLGHACID